MRGKEHCAKVQQKKCHVLHPRSSWVFPLAGRRYCSLKGIFHCPMAHDYSNDNLLVAERKTVFIHPLRQHNWQKVHSGTRFLWEKHNWIIHKIMSKEDMFMQKEKLLVDSHIMLPLQLPDIPSAKVACLFWRSFFFGQKHVHFLHVCFFYFQPKVFMRFMVSQFQVTGSVS